MAKKLLEMNAAELAGAMLELAEPIGNIVNDEGLWDAFRRGTIKAVGLGKGDNLKIILKAYSEVIPQLLGEAHKRDTFKILSIIEGLSLKALMEKNGREVLIDAIKSFKEQLEPFFTPSVHTGARG